MENKDKILIKCKCGCGKPVIEWNIYINHHHTKGNQGWRFRKEHKGSTQPKSEEWRKKVSEIRKQRIKEGKIITLKGENHPRFNNWSSREPYGKEWSGNLREFIRKRDNYRCQQCFRHQNELSRKLNIHHIDFNKRNNSENNLISLCDNCHIQTQFNRQDWISYFKERMVEGGKIG